jgi:hypothetical protein
VFASNVQPKRRVKQKPAPWRCACPAAVASSKLNGGHLIRCPDCGSQRGSTPRSGWAADAGYRAIAPAGSHRPLSIASSRPGLGEFEFARERAEFRCACGYGIVVDGPLPACPMCRGSSWETLP